MTAAERKDDKHAADRPQRFTSHALVELRKFKHLPFFVYSAVLLDVSLGGFKIEFTSEVMTKPGDQYWFNIPLTPLGIYAPTRLLCKGEVRWFDDKRYRVGGVFMHLSKVERLIIEQVVDTLKQRGAIA
jgi:hypothetical protein